MFVLVGCAAQGYEFRGWGGGDEGVYQETDVDYENVLSDIRNTALHRNLSAGRSLPQSHPPGTHFQVV